MIYTDYLAANARIGANTKVGLFEEEGYEVALDYENRDVSTVNSYRNYRIYFYFKTRNSNCMAYPFALTTRNELTDFAYMENGFKLEMAKSRYLTIDIIWSAVRKVNNRYAFDARVNTATQEGREYTAVGIYSFTVKNPVTGDTTIKTIYVGDDPIYKALANGKTIDAINDILAQRSEFKEDGLVYLESGAVSKSLSNESEINGAQLGSDINADESIAGLEKDISDVSEKSEDTQSESLPADLNKDQENQ